MLIVLLFVTLSVLNFLFKIIIINHAKPRKEKIESVKQSTFFPKMLWGGMVRRS